MITTQVIAELKNIINITQLAKEAKINSNTLHTKVREMRDLSTTESKKIEDVLNKYHLKVDVTEKEKEKEFRFEDYAHLSAKEIRKLPENIKSKILEECSRIAAQDFELIEGDPTIIDY